MRVVCEYAGGMRAGVGLMRGGVCTQVWDVEYTAGILALRHVPSGMLEASSSWLYLLYYEYKSANTDASSRASPRSLRRHGPTGVEQAPAGVYIVREYALLLALLLAYC
jgi:hypothetical protein